MVIMCKKVPGCMYEVDGCKLHLYLANRNSKGTIILISGSGTTSPYADFYQLLNELSPHVRTCVYERAGYGFSGETDSIRDIDLVINQLRNLLKKASIEPPYVFIAHSMGALEAIRFSQMYRDEVMFVVTIDGISPIYAKNFKLNIIEKFVRDFISRCIASKLMIKLAKTNLVRKLFVDIEGLPEEIQDIKIQMAIKNARSKEMKRELDMMNKNGEKIMVGKKNTGIEQISFVSENNGYKNWRAVQRDLESYFRLKDKIVYRDCGHYIHHKKYKEISRRVIDHYKEIIR